MTDTPDAPATPQANDQAAQQPKVTQRIVAQYIRDMSFENALAQKGLTGDLQPEVSVQVNLDARKRGAEGQADNAPSKVPKAKPISTACKRRSSLSAPIESLMISNFPVSTVTL